MNIKYLILITRGSHLPMRAILRDSLRDTSIEAVFTVGMGVFGYNIGSYIGEKVNRDAGQGRSAEILGSRVGGVHGMIICMFPYATLAVIILNPFGKSMLSRNYYLCEPSDGKGATWSINKITCRLN